MCLRDHAYPLALPSLLRPPLSNIYLALHLLLFLLVLAPLLVQLLLCLALQLVQHLLHAGVPPSLLRLLLRKLYFPLHPLLFLFVLAPLLVQRLVCLALHLVPHVLHVGARTLLALANLLFNTVHLAAKAGLVLLLRIDQNAVSAFQVLEPIWIAGARGWGE